MKKNKLFFIFCLFVSSSILSQPLFDAIKLTTNEQFSKADIAFTSELTAQPNNGDIYFYYGENYFKNDNLEMANKFYQKGVELNATNPLCYVGLGKVQWYQGKEAEAKASFFKAVTLAKKHEYSNSPKTLEITVSLGKNSSVTKAKYVINSEATVLMKIAEVYINAEVKNIAEAHILLAQSIKLESFNPEAYILTGDAYMEQNDGSKAIEYYEKAEKMDEKSVKAILRQGQLLNRAKNYNLALDLYKKASLIDSSFAPAYREMAEIYARAGQFNNAVAKYKRYLEINNDCDARGRYAGFLLEGKHYTESIVEANEAIKCDVNNVYLYRYLAYAYFEALPPNYILGLESSKTFFLKANEDTKVIPKDYEYQAKLLSKNGKDSMALIYFLKAMQLQPEKVELNGEIAVTYMKMKKWAEAISFFDKKIAGNKANINDYFGLTRAYYFSKDFVKSDSATSQMIRLQPDLALGYLWKAKVSVQQDLKNEKWLAKPFYEMYVNKAKPEENKKELIEAYNYLAAYYAEKKDCPNVKIYMQKVIDLDASNVQAKKVISELKC